MKIFDKILIIVILTIICINQQKEDDKSVVYLIDTVVASYSETVIADSKNADTAVLITIIDFNELQKDGCIRMNDYIVNIGDERAKLLNGKKVMISGEVTIYDSFEDDRETGNTLDRMLVDFSTLWPGSSNQKPLNKVKYTEYNMSGSNLYGRSPEDDMANIEVKQERIGRMKEIIDPKIEILE